jgi:hypothetical protein
MKSAPLIAVGLSLPLLALAADPIDVKTGLWEIVSVTESQGLPQMPPEVLDKMTEEQKEQMASIFHSATAKPARHTTKECVTEEDLAKPFDAGEENCTSTVVRSTARSQEIDVVCTGEHPSTGKLRVEALTRETMKGQLEIHVDGGDSEGEGMTIQSQLTGRWLGASCTEADEE